MSRLHSGYRRKPAVRVGFAVVVAIAISACGGGSSNKGGSSNSGGKASSNKQVVVGATDTRTATFGPWSQSTHSDGLVNTLIFSNLVKIAPNEKTVLPDLASSWTVSRNAKVFTFHLRSGVKWSDGKPFTANDVVFTITQAAQLGGAAYIGYQPEKWLEVGGAASVQGTNKPVPGVKALNAHTVQVTLGEPDAQFIRNLAAAVYAIVPAHSFPGATPKNIRGTQFATTAPVGTGPYTLTKNVPNQYLEFTANPSYFGGAPKIKTIFFKSDLTDAGAVTQLQSGELQVGYNLAPNDYQTLKSTSGIKSVFVTSPGAEFLQFRVDSPRVSDPRVRQAFYYAINRNALVKDIASGRGTVRWSVPGFDQSASDLNRYPYNPTKAKQLLQAANFDFSKPLPLLYVQSGVDPFWSRLGAVIAQYMKAVGVNIALDPVDAAKWEADLTAKNPPYAVTFNSGGNTGFGPDFSSLYFNCKTPVDTYYRNCQVTNQYRAALATTDTTKQAAIYAKIAKTLNTAVPWATLWQTDNLYAYSANLGGSFASYADWRDSFSNIANWTIK